MSKGSVLPRVTSGIDWFNFVFGLCDLLFEFLIEFLFCADRPLLPLRQADSFSPAVDAARRNGISPLFGNESPMGACVVVPVMKFVEALACVRYAIV